MIIDIVIHIIFLISIGILVNSIIIINRNKKTTAFLRTINELVSSTTQKLIKNATPDNIDQTEILIEEKRQIHNKLLNYKKIMYSYKPFELSSWLSEDEIKKLKQDEI